MISTIGANAEGQPYNVNADEAARAIAVAMNAEKIVYLTAVPGLLEDATTRRTLIPRLTAAELRERIAHESVGKGMIPKLKACADAVDQGVGFAHIIDGRVQHSLLIELLTDHGVGTMVSRRRAGEASAFDARPRRRRSRSDPRSVRTARAARAPG